MSDNPIPTGAKPWWQSRTMWVNLVLVVVGLAVYILQGIQTGQLQNPFGIAPDTLAFWIGVLNMVLRYITTQPIAKGDGELP